MVLMFLQAVLSYQIKNNIYNSEIQPSIFSHFWFIRFIHPPTYNIFCKHVGRMSQLSREILFSGCYLNPDTSSWPEPKHQHKPPTLKALGVELKQSSIACVYFPCVTSTCVANTLPARSWGGGGEDMFGAGSVHTPSVSGMSSCLVWEIPLPLRQQTESCARPQPTPSISAVNAKACEAFSLSFREH